MIIIVLLENFVGEYLHTFFEFSLLGHTLVTCYSESNETEIELIFIVRFSSVYFYP